MIMSPTLGWTLSSFPLIQTSEITSEFRIIVTYRRWLWCQYWCDRVQTATHVRLKPGSSWMATFAKSRVCVALCQHEQPSSIMVWWPMVTLACGAFLRLWRCNVVGGSLCAQPHVLHDQHMSNWFGVELVITLWLACSHPKYSQMNLTTSRFMFF